MPDEVRKRRLEPRELGPKRNASNLAALATIAYSSEDPLFPVENIIDTSTGPGSPKWCAAAVSTNEEIVLEFDQPQSFGRLVFEVEENEYERIQEITIEASYDRGRSFRQLHRQEFSFSPHGATFEREDLNLTVRNISHLRCVFIPNKQGSGRACLTTLQLFP